MPAFSLLAATLGGTAAAGAAGAGAAAGGAAVAGATAATSLASTIGTIGTIGGLIGTGLQVKGAMDQSSAMKKAEDIRASQANLEATRQRRQIIRQSVAARSEALTNATQQGASQGSGLQGGFGQISGQTGNNINGVNMGQDLGNAMFANNRKIASAQTLSSVGQGVGALSSSLVKNQEAFGRVGVYDFGYGQ